MKVENTRVSRIAVSRLHLSNGEVRKNQVLEIDVETKKLSGFIRWSRRLLSRSGVVEIISCRKRFGKTCLVVVGKACPIRCSL